MAIDFSQVKTITIPEGSVKKITDSAGNTLWQGAGWHTIWEGNQKIGYGGWTGSEYLFATEHYSNALKIRVSFSKLSASSVSSGDDYRVFYTPSNQKSPVTYESFSQNQTELVKAYINNSTRNANYGAYLYYNKNTGKIYGKTSEYNAGGNAIAYIVITKIEVYS